MGVRILRITTALLKASAFGNDHIVTIEDNDIPSDAELVDSQIVHDGKYLDLYWKHPSFPDMPANDYLTGPTFSVHYYEDEDTHGD